MVDVDERSVEPVREAGTSGACAVLVIRAEHDVVGQKLRASIKQLRERLLAVLGFELIMLLHRHPWQLAALAHDLRVSLRLFGLESGELVPSRLPLLARSGLVIRHFLLLL